MNKIVASALLWLLAGPVLSVEEPMPAQSKAQAGANQTQPHDAAALQAAEQARNELARRQSVAPADITIVHIEPAQWNDSSLGCRRPGSAYLQVISAGYAVVLERGGQQHEVHVSGKSVVVCDSVAVSGNVAKAPTRAQGLQDVSARARNDLAQRLKLEPSAVRVVRMEPQRWADDSLGCQGAAKTSDAGSVSGFKLHLNASGRIYTYHTDLKRVLACPPIENE